MSCNCRAIRDAVHPEHYRKKDGKMTINDMEVLFGEAKTKAFCELNAFKYRMRAGKKGDAAEDIQKAIWYETRMNQYEKECVEEVWVVNVYEQYNNTTNVFSTREKALNFAFQQYENIMKDWDKDPETSEVCVKEDEGNYFFIDHMDNEANIDIITTKKTIR